MHDQLDLYRRRVGHVHLAGLILLFRLTFLYALSVWPLTGEQMLLPWPEAISVVLSQHEFFSGLLIYSASLIPETFHFHALSVMRDAAKLVMPGGGAPDA